MFEIPPIRIPTEEECLQNAINRRETAKSDRNQFENWFPEVESLGIPSPKSILIDFPVQLQINMVNGVDCRDDLASFVSKIRVFGKEHGYPLFMKNSLFSGKHDWKNTCYISAEATDMEIMGNISLINEMWMCVSMDTALSIVVREFIQTEPVFHAFYGRMPVTEEYRLFYRDGDPVCWQPYWPEDSIQDPDITDWKEKLKSISKPSNQNMKEMMNYASSITKELGGYWSVDFLISSDSKVNLIDMADGNRSYLDKDATQFDTN